MATKSEKEITLVPAGDDGRPGDEAMLPALDDMTPREIVAELDKYIAGRSCRRRSPRMCCRKISS